MTGASLAADGALLCRAVREAGALALERFRSGFEVHEKAPGDPVTDADLAVDAALRAALCGARPGYGWLSEESAGGPDRLRAARTWVVDPIDGTRGFVERNREWAVSAALVEAGRPVAACVFNPALDAFYEARRGAGARRNGKPIRVSAAGAAEGAALGSSRNEIRRALWRGAVPGADIRPIDAIAWRLALVAGGELDGTVSLRPKSDWDIAAGDLLVAEAGGAATTPDGAEPLYNRSETRKRGLIAAGPALHRLLLARLAQ